MDRKTLLKLQIFSGFVYIYFTSFFSLLLIISAFQTNIFLLILGIFLFWLTVLTFKDIWDDIEELTELKIKETEIKNTI